MSRIGATILLMLFLLNAYGSDYLDSIASYLTTNIESLEFQEIEKIIEQNRGSLFHLQEQISIIDRKYEESEDSRIQALILLWKSAANSGNEKAILFSEAAYDIARLSDNDNLQFRSLFVLGIEYYRKNETTKALEYLLKCKKYLPQINEINEIRLNYAFGSIYVLLENYNGAEEVFERNLMFFKNPDNKKDYPIPYMSTLFAFSNLSVIIEDYQQAASLVDEGLRVSRLTNNAEYTKEFSVMKGIVLHYLGDYFSSIDILINIINQSSKSQGAYNDGLKFVVFNFLELNELDSAVMYLSRIEEVYQENPNYALRSLKYAYVRMCTYAKENSLDSLHYEYLTKQIKVDSSYDKHSLSAAHSLINSSSTDSELKSAGVGDLLMFYCAILFLILIVLFILFRRNVVKESRNSINRVLPNEKTSMDQTVVSNLLIRLNKFEANRGYLSHDLTLSSLANQLNTNPTYLSRIINVEKGMSYSSYVKKLRIDHTLHRLSYDSVFSNYSLKSIGEESGYNSYKSFSRAFKEVVGMNPSDYLSSQNIKIKN